MVRRMEDCERRVNSVVGRVEALMTRVEGKLVAQLNAAAKEQEGTALAAVAQANEEDESSRIAEAFTVKGMKMMDTQWAEAVKKVEQSAEYTAAKNSTAGVDPMWKKAMVFDEYQLILARVRELEVAYVPETAPPSPVATPQPRSETPGASSKKQKTLAVGTGEKPNAPDPVGPHLFGPALGLSFDSSQDEAGGTGLA